MWVTKSLEAISLLIIAGIQVAYRKDLFLEEYPKAFEIALSIFIKQKKKKTEKCGLLDLIFQKNVPYFQYKNHKFGFLKIKSSVT